MIKVTKTIDQVNPRTHRLAFSCIMAVDNRWGLGRNGKIPWHSTPVGRADLDWFRRMTVGGIVIMGRKTWESLDKPLSGRFNIVIGDADKINKHTKRMQVMMGCEVIAPYQADNFDGALDIVGTLRDGHDGAFLPLQAYMIGGAQIYKIAARHPRCCDIIISSIPLDYDCDVFVDIGPDWKLWGTHTVSSELYRFRMVRLLARDKAGIEMEMKSGPINTAELAYLNLMAEIAELPTRPSRSVPASSSFARRLEFDLADQTMPLLTTKTVSWKSVVVELLWFLRGCRSADVHDTSFLEENGVKIWRGNTSRKYLDSVGMKDREEGYVGPIYGAQWRSWPGRNGPIDQLGQVIENLKADPFGRRHVVSAWNVDALDEVVLPPCHYSFQFHVDQHDGVLYLNCLVNMRSADMFLGVPFNIASYALLTHMVSALTSMEPGKLVLSMADCHVYETHREAIAKQCRRTPGSFPTVILPSAKTIDDFANADPGAYQLIDYYCREVISAPMA